MTPAGVPGGGGKNKVRAGPLARPVASWEVLSWRERGPLHRDTLRVATVNLWGEPLPSPD